MRPPRAAPLPQSYALSPTPAVFTSSTAGDYLYKIAQEKQTTVDAIMRLNPGINPSMLSIGQVSSSKKLKNDWKTDHMAGRGEVG